MRSILHENYDSWLQYGPDPVDVPLPMDFLHNGEAGVLRSIEGPNEKSQLGERISPVIGF